MRSLADKLKSMGVKVEAREPSSPPQTESYPIEQILPGQFQATAHGDVFVAETTYPAHYRHGRAGLQVTASLRTIAEWAGDRQIATASLENFVFLDTETTGLAGGTGTYAFLVGLGRFDGAGFRLAQFFMRDPAEEPAQLAALTEFIQPCRTLVTFNGKAFDVPLLNSRFITNGEPPALRAVAQLDLLHLARRLWRDRLPSRTLSQLELRILEAARSHEDIPGWLIPSVYFDYLRSGDARPLKNVFYHNAMDVLAMAALLSHMADLIDDPLNGTLDYGLDWVALGKLYEQLGYLDLAAQLYRRGLARELPTESYWDTLRRLSFLQRRRGDWPSAIELWQEAAAGHQLYAHIELAKYYEHRARDYAEALRWTEAALALTESSHVPRPERQRMRSEITHRLARLGRKLAR